ncbi:MAG: hypothetical protein M1819_006351 [Sarea resinae]|nr:MAG: hypothetical protein M1819_006351 [Sarea resinae]
MRLRLTVLRHELPPSQVLWIVADLPQTHGSATANHTISQLLDQVNGIIPLEAEDWGLEDYIVEVRGFECLHFSELKSVLKDDDEVTIRPLQTSDLRMRRLAGRHQISSDGKHLIDGVAFGRPFLRHADRPPITIPPRKRRRLTYGGDDDADNEPMFGERQLTITDGDGDLDDEEDEDDDFSPEEGSEDDEEDGSQMLDDEEESPETLSPGLEAAESLDEGIGRSRRTQLRGALTKRSTESQGLERTGSDSSNKGVRFEDSYNILSGLDPDIGAFRTDEDETLAERDYSMMADDLAAAGTDEEGTQDEPGTSNESDDSGSAEESSSSDSESDENESSSEEDSDSDSESESESESDSEPEQLSSRLPPQPKGSELRSTPVKAKEPAEKELEPTRPQETPTKKSASVKPPGQGERATQKRNERRRIHRKIEALKSKGVLPSNANREEYEKWKATQPAISISGLASSKVAQSGTSTPINASTEPASASETRNEDEEFEARRQKLLGDIASGGIEVEPSSGKKKRQKTRDSKEPITTAKATKEAPEEATEHQNVAPHADGPASSTSDTITSGESNVVAPTRRRATLNVSSSRRMLFSSLGLRTPKTKEEEEKIKQGLMKNARPGSKGKQDTENAVAEKADDNTTNDAGNVELAPGQQLQDGDGEWEKKIILKAVECCEDGVELSAPPFPFVQRWDPQQQYSSSRSARRGGKGKKRKRNQSSYYQEEEEGYDDGHEMNGHYEDAIEELNYDEPGESGLQPKVRRVDSDQDANAINSQLMMDADGLSAGVPGVDDLPAVPADISTYKTIGLDDIQPGSVITFKQLDMSEATGWQPKISVYRTSKVEVILADGTLNMRLAKRDRPQSERAFDEETGQRIYGKFEMPGYDDDDDDGTEDAGFLELPFGELIDPKLLGAAEDEPSSAPQDPSSEVIGQSEHAEGTADDRIVSPAVEIEANSGDENNQGDSGADPISITQEAQHEYSDLMRDAGFRSSVGSGIAIIDQTFARGLESRSASPLSTDESQGYAANGTYPSDSHDDMEVEESPSSAFRYAGASESLHGSSPSSNSLSRNAVSNIASEITNGRSLNAVTAIPSLSRAISPAVDDIKNREADEDESVNMPRSVPAVHESLFLSDTPDPVAVAATETVQPQARNSPTRKFGSRPQLDGASSDNELPTLDAVFSTARTSIGMSSDGREDEDSDGAEAEEEAIPPITTSSPPYNGRVTTRKTDVPSHHQRRDSVSSVHDDQSDDAADDDALPAPAPVTLHATNHAPASSAETAPVIDLTMSSDPVQPPPPSPPPALLMSDDNDDGDYSDSIGLPTGPGWVQKRRSGRVRESGTGGDSGRGGRKVSLRSSKGKR